MNCDEMVELISAHIDGELSPAEQQVLEQHLNQCPQCSSLQQRLLHMEAAYRGEYWDGGNWHECTEDAR